MIENNINTIGNASSDVRTRVSSQKIGGTPTEIIVWCQIWLIG